MKLNLKYGKNILILFLMFFILVIIIVIGEASVSYVLKRKNNADYQNMNVSITSNDKLTLYGKLYQHDTQTHNWVIFVHSYGSDHSFMNPYAKYYQENGYNTLAVDNRAHGVSEGKYIGMGYLDQYDVREWIEYIIKIDPEASIILHGVSMGAATVMMVSAQDDLPDNVKGIIEDCGYKSAESYLKWKLKQRFHLPAFPIIPITNLAFKLKAGYWMTDASAIDAVKQSKVSTLFIHGTEDETVPVEDVYDLYNTANCSKSIYIVKGAAHGQSLELNEEEYWNNVNNFLQDINY